VVESFSKAHEGSSTRIFAEFVIPVTPRMASVSGLKVLCAWLLLAVGCRVVCDPVEVVQDPSEIGQPAGVPVWLQLLVCRKVVDIAIFRYRSAPRTYRDPADTTRVKPTWTMPFLLLVTLSLAAAASSCTGKYNHHLVSVRQTSSLLTGMHANTAGAFSFLQPTSTCCALRRGQHATTPLHFW